MATIKSSERQNIIDVAIQKAGDPHAAFEIARENGLSVTDNLEPGQSIEVSSVGSSDIVDYYERKGVVAETAEKNLPETFDRLFGDEFGEEFE